MTTKVVLAYSGGLDTSVSIPWLREHYGCEVVAMVGDVGQGEDLDEVAAKALRTGASKAYVEDLRGELVIEYIWPTLRAGAIYENKYLLGTSMARPLLAKRQVAIALRERADGVAHGCTGKGNDQVRFELAYQALAPQLRVIAPWREWSIRSREDALAYAQARAIPVAASAANLYSRDRNLWHLSHEGGTLEDPSHPPPDSLWQLTSSPEAAPDRPEEVEIGFEQGTPVSVNGERLPPVALVETLNTLGSRHGVGRVDLVENRFVGIKSRGCYETPGGTLLVTAHQELEALALERDLFHFKQQVALKYAELVYYGQWFTPLRAALDAFVSATQVNVTGCVALKLYKGNVTITDRRSPHSLYSTHLASFSMDHAYNQKDAEGFIRILGLPARVQALLHKRGVPR